MERLRHEQDAYERFESAEGWRRGDLVSLDHQLDRHWAEVVAACVGADDPLAYGIGQLRHARSTLDTTDGPSTPPSPRTGPTSGSRSVGSSPVWSSSPGCPTVLADSEAQLQDAGGAAGAPRPPGHRQRPRERRRREGRAQQATKAERDLLERLAALAEHQDHIADVAAQRQELGTTLAQVDAALDRTRPDRVAALAEDPPGHLSSGSGRRRAHPQAGPCGATTPSTSKPTSTATTAPYHPGPDGAPKPTWLDTRSRLPTVCSKPAPTAPGQPNGPSSPSKLAPSSTRCFEPNGTAPPDRARQTNGNERTQRRGPVLEPKRWARV